MSLPCVFCVFECVCVCVCEEGEFHPEGSQSTQICVTAVSMTSSYVIRPEQEVSDGLWGLGEEVMLGAEVPLDPETLQP